MLRIILLLVWIGILFSACSPKGEYFKTIYDPQFKVVDRGNLDVIVKSRACALFAQDAVFGAMRSAEFHLRSVIGNQNHRKKFQEVNRYNEDNKICVEMSATAMPPL